MRLAEMQRALHDVLRTSSPPPNSDDPELSVYLREVTSSGRVEILKGIMESWRMFDVKRACPLTAAVLHARGSWESSIKVFGAESQSPFVEQVASRFLDLASEHLDPLIASVARFERAYLAALRGSRERYVVRWDRDPAAVLSRLAMRMPLDDLDADNTYFTIVGSDLPNLFEIGLISPAD